MAEEKQYREQITMDSDLTHEHTNRSHGLHHDHVAQEALGGRTADLGKSYFTSINFIGTVIVRLGAPLSDERSSHTGYVSSTDIRVALWPTQHKTRH
jgi:hypothetical protein